MESEDDIIVIDLPEERSTSTSKNRSFNIKHRIGNTQNDDKAVINVDEPLLPAASFKNGNTVIDLTFHDGVGTYQPGPNSTALNNEFTSNPSRVGKRKSSIHGDDVEEVDVGDECDCQIVHIEPGSGLSLAILQESVNLHPVQTFGFRQNHCIEAAQSVTGLKNDCSFGVSSHDMTRSNNSRNTKRRKFYNDESDVVEVIDASKTITKLSPQQAAIYQVQEIFPLVDPDYILSILTYPITAQSIQAIIQELVAAKEYPKIKIESKQNHLKTIDYANDDYEQSLSYKHQCYEYLLQDFPFVSKSGMLQLLTHHNGRYHRTFMHIVDMIKHSKDGCSNIEKYDEYVKLISGKKVKNLDSSKFMFDKDGIRYSIALKNPRKIGDRMQLTDQVLSDEVKFTQDRMNEWGSMIQKDRERLIARKKAQESGVTVECTCCYGDYAFEEMVSCQYGHLFCMDCLRRYAEERIFGNNDLGTKGSVELCCMDTSGCDSWFSRDQLEKSLSLKVMKKYDELQAAIVLEKAKLDGLCKCPRCDFQASLPESEGVFKCPNCLFESCRKCGEESHIPLRCNEVERKTETHARLQVEEAMTQARIRYCPKGCKQGFYKVSTLGHRKCKVPSFFAQNSY